MCFKTLSQKYLSFSNLHPPKNYFTGNARISPTCNIFFSIKSNLPFVVFFMDVQQFPQFTSGDSPQHGKHKYISPACKCIFKKRIVPYIVGFDTYVLCKSWVPNKSRIRIRPPDGTWIVTQDGTWNHNYMKPRWFPEYLGIFLGVMKPWKLDWTIYFS